MSNIGFLKRPNKLFLFKPNALNTIRIAVNDDTNLAHSKIKSAVYLYELTKCEGELLKSGVEQIGGKR